MFAPPTPTTAALAWADRLYARVAPLPLDDPVFGINTAREAYRQVLRRYPGSRARIGVGDCSMLRGQYDEAAKAYGSSRLAAEARRRAVISRACATLSKGRSVVQIEPIPGTAARWIALLSKINPGSSMPGDWFPPGFTETSIIQVRYADGRATRVGPETPLKAPPDFDWWRGMSLYVHQPCKSGVPLAIVYASCPSASNDWTAQWVATVGSAQIQVAQRFVGAAPAEFYATTTASHGMVAVVEPTRKVPWSDAYEWDGRRFVFANRRHPELFKPWPHEDGYSDEMIHAAIVTIRGRRRAALSAWCRAERVCRLSIQYGGEYGSHYWDAGYMGDKQENLKEIRQRIRWLRKGEMNHALLYRPYDFDLQVPPYKLGNARD